MTAYSEKFKSEMVAKMLGPDAISANALSRRVGIGQTTLSTWLRQAKMAGVSGRSKTKPGPRRAWTPAEKLRVVAAAEQLGDEQLGALLRREGLHETDLRAFREEALAGLSPKPAKRGPTPEEKRIKELERELHRKEKALAEAAALLVLRKKLNALWGEAEGEDTTEQSEPTSFPSWKKP